MLLAALTVAASVVAPVAASADDDKTILLIYAEARLIPAIVTADQAIRSTIESGWPSRVSYLSGLPMSEILTAVGTLPKGTVVVLGAFLRDGAGRTFTTPEALSLLAGASAAPIYGFGQSLLGHGIVGGPLISFEAQGVKAADWKHWRACWRAGRSGSCSNMRVIRRLECGGSR